MRWISSRRACEILGVNPDTLRQWTDQGKLPAYVTPGGHRRYDERALLDLVARPTAEPDVVPELPLFASHDQYEALVRRCLAGESWFPSFSAGARQQFRILGNSMLHLLGSYVLADSARERGLSLERAREVASEHGRTAASAGLSARDATHAFLLFRTPIIETLAEWSRRRASGSDRFPEMLRRVNQFMDEVLITMVTAHTERATAPERADASGR
jgi:excisionase family DNA binding protein